MFLHLRQILMVLFALLFVGLGTTSASAKVSDAPSHWVLDSQNLTSEVVELNTARAPPMSVGYVVVAGKLPAFSGDVFEFATIASLGDTSDYWQLVIAPKGGDVPQITKNRQHHEQKVGEVTDDLEAQGYQVDTEVSFRGCDTTKRCRADVVARDENGRIVKVVEVKTGNAGLSPNQAEIYPQVANGDAIPTGNVADRLGLDVGVPLKDQGYPNGIPVEVRTFEGVNQ